MPFNTLQFRHPWRPYQQRVLAAVQDHLADQRLHVVAAPGAGKTTLGLEIFRILEKPALVLSPTRVIRGQWLERLRDFCTTETPSALPWVSKSIHQPGVLTSVTYQALHSLFAEELAADAAEPSPEDQVEEEAALDLDDGLNKSEINGFIDVIRRHQIGVLILDEAHHLRAEWWRALEKVCRHCPELILVSLTATPPYDAQDHEWSRYEQLCGPIDEEISVPELVKAGTLCPHQDYIWACDATLDEKEELEEYDRRVSELLNSLISSEVFEAIVMAHPWITHGETRQDLIREPHVAVALLSFMRAKNLSLNEEFLQRLDLSARDVPDLGRKQWQVLVEAILFSKTFQHSEPHLAFVEQLKKQLRASELLHKRELSLQWSRRLERCLSLSRSKVDACLSIHKLELKHRGDSLRQVILTDYIRDEGLLSDIESGELNLGAWPVFKRITAGSPIADKVALLTGRISILPTALVPALMRALDADNVKTEPMGNQQQYHRVYAPLNQLTTAFTQLLMQGDIKVLVGTRSLLGEGWDAPVVNSIVLASSVGSFMLTNQMRGRAIRIDRQAPDKISSIWHLVAINTSSYFGWSDYVSLRKRFDTFVGLSEKGPIIESGFERMLATGLQVSVEHYEKAPIRANNLQMIRRFRKLHQLQQRWQSALSQDGWARVVPSVQTNYPLPRLRGYHLTHCLSYLLIQLGGMVMFAVMTVLQSRPSSVQQLFLFLAIVILAAMVYNLPRTYSIVKTLLLHLPVDGALRQIGNALLAALCNAGFIRTEFQQMEVKVSRLGDGSYYIGLVGATFYESSLYADGLAEILAPIENPRYLVLRKGDFLTRERAEYHALPLKFAVKKEYATIFHEAWCKHVSPSELIYTRTEEGQARLLKARMRAFSSNFSAEVKRLDRWS